MTAARAPKTPEAVDELFGEYMNAGDLESLIALYEAKGVLIGQDGTPLIGHAAIRRYFEAFGDAKMAIKMKVTKVVKSGDDIAVLYNDWTGSFTGPDGERNEMSGKALEIVRRQADGSWRFIIDDPNARG
jgi:uncharacterized protein (TIGR02246 family)